MNPPAQTPTRRAWLGMAAAACACRRAEPPPFRFRLAVCNETFQPADFAESCRLARETGYTGLEIAPWTLHDNPAALTQAARAEHRRAMADEGLTCVGLHSLLTAPAGELHITTPDDRVRNRSWDYFRRLIDLCADLGGDKLMILGSGKQRRAVGGSSAADALQRLADGLARAAPQAEAQGVTILPETLAPHLCDVMTTMEETMRIVRRIGSPAVQTMFDTHNAVAETLPHDRLIKKYGLHIRHVHVNEMDGSRPGAGGYDFAAPMQALKDIHYRGRLSLEVFRFEPSGEVIAREAAQFLRRVEAGLA